MVQALNFYLLVDLLSPRIVLNAIVHLRWEGLFGLIPCTTIPSWNWYAGMPYHHARVI